MPDTLSNLRILHAEHSRRDPRGNVHLRWRCMSRSECGNSVLLSYLDVCSGLTIVVGGRTVRTRGGTRSHLATWRTLTRHEFEIQTDPDGRKGRSGGQAPTLKFKRLRRTQPSSRIGGFFTRVHKHIPEPLVHSLPLIIPEFIQNQGTKWLYYRR